jgi:hypothetical protein
MLSGMARRGNCSGALFGALVVGVVGVGLIETVGMDATAIVGFVTLVVWLLMQLVRRRRSRRG